MKGGIFIHGKSISSHNSESFDWLEILIAHDYITDATDVVGESWWFPLMKESMIPCRHSSHLDPENPGGSSNRLLLHFDSALFVMLLYDSKCFFGYKSRNFILVFNWITWVRFFFRSCFNSTWFFLLWSFLDLKPIEIMNIDLRWLWFSRLDLFSFGTLFIHLNDPSVFQDILLQLLDLFPVPVFSLFQHGNLHIQVNVDLSNNLGYTFIKCFLPIFCSWFFRHHVVNHDNCNDSLTGSMFLSFERRSPERKTSDERGRSFSRHLMGETFVSNSRSSWPDSYILQKIWTLKVAPWKQLEMKSLQKQVLKPKIKLRKRIDLIEMLPQNMWLCFGEKFSIVFRELVDSLPWSQLGHSFWLENFTELV